MVCLITSPNEVASDARNVALISLNLSGECVTLEEGWMSRCTVLGRQQWDQFVRSRATKYQKLIHGIHVN